MSKQKICHFCGILINETKWYYYGINGATGGPIIKCRKCRNKNKEKEMLKTKEPIEPIYNRFEILDL